MKVINRKQSIEVMKQNQTILKQTQNHKVFRNKSETNKFHIDPATVCSLNYSSLLVIHKHFLNNKLPLKYIEILYNYFIIVYY